MNKDEQMPVLMAVYGTLKRGFGNNYLLKDAKFMGRHITEPKYTMYSRGGFPISVDRGTTPLTCEIFEVTDPNTVSRVNALEGFSGVKGSSENWYDRQTIPTEYGDAEIYIMHEPQNLSVVENGNWKDTE